MTTERKSKFDISLVFANTDEQVCTMYHKHFRDVQKTKVEKMDILSGEDCMILPMPSCFGIYSNKSGLVFSIMQTLGEELAQKIQTHILKKYLGEQPLGSAFLLRNPQKNSSFRFILVVALFRALTCAGDDMARIDPQDVPKDFAYNAIRGCLITILKHNAVADKNRISTVYCPDFFTVRKEGPGGDKLTLTDFDSIVGQQLIAVRGILEPSKGKKDWTHALAITKLISNTNVAEDLMPLLDSGALETRGLYSFAELDQVMSAAQDNKNKDRQEAAIRVLAACLHRTDDQFNIPKRDVAHRILAQKGGCLALLLDMVIQRKITVHTEIPHEELTIGEIVGEGTGGSVYRGTWRGKHVAIKQFKKDISYEEFIKELSIMCVVHHPNLVRCYGGVTTGDRKWIVDELMQVNLSVVLAEKSVPIDMGMIAEIAINAAAGIDYLHTHCNLIHRDLKSMNLLINTHKTHLDVKVCDFALSRVINKKEHMTGNVGTVSWIAPEVIEGRKKYNEKADVYSFGIILWELISREVPFKWMASFAIPLAVIKGKRPPLPSNCPADLKRLITHCWSPKPKARPQMAAVILLLRKFHRGLPLSEKAQITLNVTNLIASTPKRKGHSWAVSSHEMVPLTERSERTSKTKRLARSTCSSTEKEKNGLAHTNSETTDRSDYNSTVSSDEESS